jgi:hypothetical protein
MKIRRFTEFQSQIRYPNFDTDYSIIYDSFLQTRLGELYQAIPWQGMISCFGLKQNRKGPQSIFSPRGKIALMFLKHYVGCSDKKLMEHLNGNIHYQIFCDVIISPTDPIKNYKIISEIRCELSLKLDIPILQSVLVDKWKPYMTNLASICCDATCYESDIRYPTDIKLVWEAVSWNYKNLQQISRRLGKRTPRTKMIKWSKRYMNYSKSRKPSRKTKRSLRRGLLKLLKKMDDILSELEKQVNNEQSKTYWERRHSSKLILTQQGEYFFEGKKPKDRIVSMDKPYLRPIVRGKEVKKVEFGAKVNKFQVDGIGFIEHISFDAFNEGTRLKSTIWAAQKLLKKRIRIIGADAIYATNANRKFVTKHKIKTDFKRKGKPSKHKDHYMQLAKMITKERATRLEGSFGTDKEYYLLKRIKARTKHTEILWIFFGIHTSNGLQIGKRMSKILAKAA